MKEDKETRIEKRKEEKLDAVGFSIEEFSIVELEDRLEMASRCNPNCNCNT
jgi:hypothetical protein